MKLVDFVCDNFGTVVKIGSGTGFIFCDTLNDKTIDLLDDYAHHDKVYRENRLDEMHNKYDTWDKWWPAYVEKQIKMFKEAKEENKKWCLKYNKTPWTKTVKERRKELVHEGIVRKTNLKKAIDYETNYLKNWIKYSERSIKEIYDSIDEEGTKICIFEGDEAGKWWTTEEYRTGVIK